ncbi:unnamed protein product [Rotaria sp. Silwood1]|nr:unnamed protein product [Rotaria sp. Silwood1]CAF1592874.1 unnamed protein product [Rotaria sp. Silwood1]CAF3738824.1 unnamed protein product [Rotaria sp. Silwood1]CAF4836826.1 unnamed protein product [Rotaria sp. Silwood1]
MDTKQRFMNLLNILSFKATRLLIAFEYTMPSYLKPKKTSSVTTARNQFARELIQHELQETYSFDQILYCRNIINANTTSKMEMGINIDLQDTINRFKINHPHHPYIQDLNTISLVPFRTTCNNILGDIECGNQLKIEFHMTGFILYPTSIQPCTLYSGECGSCNRSYRISSIYCYNEKIIITPESLEQNNFFHLSSGKLVFSREILVSFSSDLVNGHVSCNGAGTSLLSKVARLHPEFNKKFDSVQIIRSLEAHWIYFELFNFIFMTSSEKEIVAPRALFAGRNIQAGGIINVKAQFLEERLDWMYNLFSIFWSHHNLIPECVCDKSICSRVLVLDGHQKPRRTVCRFDNVTSLVNQEELGPCNRGCPYQPKRRTPDKKNKNKRSPLYCYFHQNLEETMSLSTKEHNQREQAWYNELKSIQKQNILNNNTTHESCNVVRSEEVGKDEEKRRSMGFLASFLSCGIIIGFTESINHEGVRMVTDHLLTMIKMGTKLPNAMIYDAACNLKLFWNKQYRGIHLKETPSSTSLFNMRVAVDRFHHKNHVHSICKTITNPDCALTGNDEIYRGINTSIAEQSFRYLSEFKLSLRRLAYPTSTVFSILLLHLWNCRRIQISPDSFGLGVKYMSDKIKPLFLTYCIFETAQLYQKKVEIESFNLTYIQDDDVDDDGKINIETSDNNVEQLNYDCYVNMEQYTWDSDESGDDHKD